MGAVIAPKVLHRSVTETRELLGGTKENNVLPDGRVIDLPPRQIDDIYYTKQT